MSRRIKQPGAASRRTRRSAEPQAKPAVSEFGFVESQRVVSNPIFYCAGNGRHKPSSGDQLRCVYGPGSLGAFVHDPAPAPSKGSSSGIGNGKPLALPPCRAHHCGAGVGPAVAAGTERGRLLRRWAHQQQQQDDPFLAAYVACSKGSSGGVKVKRHSEEKTRRTKGEKGGIVQGCGGVSWAASVKHAGAAMSCRDACAVVNLRARDAAAAAKEKVEVEAGPKLDLSWAPVVLSARAVERRSEQR
ncbi:hypothetical protein QOZ80_3AG0217750 [Eleusine coracana subsp. coracana]|nr:hypothetical protein QOZ80_3AG0217750 [Eleusine coracana subsp. coracana]